MWRAQVTWPLRGGGGPTGGSTPTSKPAGHSAPPSSRRTPDNVCLLREAAQVRLRDVGARGDDTHMRGAGVRKRGMAEQRRGARTPHVRRDEGVLPVHRSARQGCKKSNERGSTTACNTLDVTLTRLVSEGKATGPPAPQSPSRRWQRVGGNKKKKRLTGQGLHCAGARTRAPLLAATLLAVRPPPGGSRAEKTRIGPCRAQRHQTGRAVRVQRPTTWRKRKTRTLERRRAAPSRPCPPKRSRACSFPTAAKGRHVPACG